MTRKAKLESRKPELAAVLLLLIPMACAGQQATVKGNVHVNGNVMVGATAGSAPTITGVSPSSGTFGSLVTVNGTNFGNAQGSSGVWFNAVPATAVAWSATSLVLAVPAGTSTGPLTVSVNGGTTSVSFTVDPLVMNLSSVSGGTMTIYGTDFGAAVGTVTIDGTQVTVNSWTNTSVNITLPSNLATGTHSVVVKRPDGQSTNGMSFFVPSSAGCGG